MPDTPSFNIANQPLSVSVSKMSMTQICGMFDEFIKPIKQSAEKSEAHLNDQVDLTKKIDLNTQKIEKVVQDVKALLSTKSSKVFSRSTVFSTMNKHLGGIFGQMQKMVAKFDRTSLSEKSSGRFSSSNVIAKSISGLDATLGRMESAISAMSGAKSEKENELNASIQSMIKELKRSGLFDASQIKGFEARKKGGANIGELDSEMKKFMPTVEKMADSIGLMKKVGMSKSITGALGSKVTATGMNKKKLAELWESEFVKLNELAQGISKSFRTMKGSQAVTGLKQMVESATSLNELMVVSSKGQQGAELFGKTEDMLRTLEILGYDAKKVAEIKRNLFAIKTVGGDWAKGMEQMRSLSKEVSLNLDLRSKLAANVSELESMVAKLKFIGQGAKADDLKKKVDEINAAVKGENDLAKLSSLLSRTTKEINFEESRKGVEHLLQEMKDLGIWTGIWEAKLKIFGKNIGDVDLIASQMKAKISKQDESNLLKLQNGYGKIASMLAIVSSSQMWSNAAEFQKRTQNLATQMVGMADASGQTTKEIRAQAKSMVYTSEGMLHYNEAVEGQNKLYQIGIADLTKQKDILDMSAASFHEMGIDFGEIVDHAGSMAFDLKLSGKQAAVLVRGVSSMQRQYGFSAQHIISIQKGSQKIFENIRNVVGSSVQATSEITRMSVAIEKARGNTDLLKDVYETFTGGIDSFQSGMEKLGVLGPMMLNNLIKSGHNMFEIQGGLVSAGDQNKALTESLGQYIKMLKGYPKNVANMMSQIQMHMPLEQLLNTYEGTLDKQKTETDNILKNIVDTKRELEKTSFFAFSKQKDLKGKIAEGWSDVATDAGKMITDIQTKIEKQKGEKGSDLGGLGTTNKEIFDAASKLADNLDKISTAAKNAGTDLNKIGVDPNLSKQITDTMAQISGGKASMEDLSGLMAKAQKSNAGALEKNAQSLTDQAKQNVLDRAKAGANKGQADVLNLQLTALNGIQVLVEHISRALTIMSAASILKPIAGKLLNWGGPKIMEKIAQYGSAAAETAAAAGGAAETAAVSLAPEATAAIGQATGVAFSAALIPIALGIADIALVVHAWHKWSQWWQSRKEDKARAEEGKQFGIGTTQNSISAVVDATMKSKRDAAMDAWLKDPKMIEKNKVNSDLLDQFESLNKELMSNKGIMSNDKTRDDLEYRQLNTASFTNSIKDLARVKDLKNNKASDQDIAVAVASANSETFVKGLGIKLDASASNIDDVLTKAQDAQTSALQSQNKVLGDLAKANNIAVPSPKLHEGGVIPGPAGKEVLGMFKAGEVVAPRVSFEDLISGITATSARSVVPGVGQSQFPVNVKDTINGAESANDDNLSALTDIGSNTSQMVVLLKQVASLLSQPRSSNILPGNYGGKKNPDPNNMMAMSRGSTFYGDTSWLYNVAHVTGAQESMSAGG